METTPTKNTQRSQSSCLIDDIEQEIYVLMGFDYPLRRGRARRVPTD